MFEDTARVSDSQERLCICVCVQMGYAHPQQKAAGIHTRLYSRAFIVDDGRKRLVFVTADVGMISQRLRLEVCVFVCVRLT